MDLPEGVKKIIQAIRTSEKIEGKIDFLKINRDWLIWEEYNGPLRAGALRYIVPEPTYHWFAIPSYCCADPINGVSYEYEIRIKEAKELTQQVAKIIAQHTEVGVVEIFKALKQTPISLGIHFLHTPLKLIRELIPYKVHLDLERPQNKGGYSI